MNGTQPPRKYKSDFARRHYEQGWIEGYAEGWAHVVLEVLAARGFEVPESVRVRVSECADVEQLKVWMCRAATIDSVEDLFEERAVLNPGR